MSLKLRYSEPPTREITLEVKTYICIYNLYRNVCILIMINISFEKGYFLQKEIGVKREIKFDF